MLLVTHVAIEVIGMPEWTCTPQVGIGPPCGERLPALYDIAQRSPVLRLNDDMYVVRHKAPRKQAIALTVEMKQRVLNKCRNLRSAQPACTQTIVEIALDAMDLGLAMPQCLTTAAGRLSATRKVTN